MNILEHGKDLKMLVIFICQMDMDWSVYNAILASIKTQREVKFEILDGNIDENIFKSNDQRLQMNCFK